MRSRAKWLTGMLTTVPGRTDGTMTTFGMGVYSSHTTNAVDPVSGGRREVVPEAAGGLAGGGTVPAQAARRATRSSAALVRVTAVACYARCGNGWSR